MTVSRNVIVLAILSRKLGKGGLSIFHPGGGDAAKTRRAPLGAIASDLDLPSERVHVRGEAGFAVVRQVDTCRLAWASALSRKLARFFSPRR